MDERHFAPDGRRARRVPRPMRRVAASCKRPDGVRDLGVLPRDRRRAARRARGRRPDSRSASRRALAAEPTVLAPRARHAPAAAAWPGPPRRRSPRSPSSAGSPSSMLDPQPTAIAKAREAAAVARRPVASRQPVSPTICSRIRNIRRRRRSRACGPYLRAVSAGGPRCPAVMTLAAGRGPAMSGRGEPAGGTGAARLRARPSLGSSVLAAVAGARWPRMRSPGSPVRRTAARQLNYVGTIVYQHGGRVETSRLTHLNDIGRSSRSSSTSTARRARSSAARARSAATTPTPRSSASSRARSATRSRRCRRSSRRRSPSSTTSGRPRPARVAGLETQAWVFEPKDGLRYGHKFWADAATGLLLKARLVDERNEVVEQFAFTEVAIGAQDRRATMVQADVGRGARRIGRSARPAGRSRMRRRPAGRSGALPPGFVKIVEGFRHLRGKRDRSRISSTRTVWSRCRCSSSRSAAAPHADRTVARRAESTSTSGSRRPPGDRAGRGARRTVRQIANSVARR